MPGPAPEVEALASPCPPLRVSIHTGPHRHPTGPVGKRPHIERAEVQARALAIPFDWSARFLALGNPADPELAANCAPAKAASPPAMPRHHLIKPTAQAPAPAGGPR